MIEHIIDPIKFLEESKRILRRNGFIILTFPNCLAYYLRLYLFLNFYPYG
ncbi:MAG: hypothetical protein H3Z52_04040 [archaeon]|nr:hypothetical protein [archaeon]